MNLIDKWTAMQAVQGIDSVATLRDGDPVIRMSAVEHVLENLPETEPERKTGRWIPTASEKGRHECSRCHEYAPCYQDGSEHLSTFCVLCGAKMEEGEQE